MQLIAAGERFPLGVLTSNEQSDTRGKSRSIFLFTSSSTGTPFAAVQIKRKVRILLPPGVI